MTEAVSMKQVFDELKKIEREMATKKEMESLVETISVMSNSETMKQISESLEDIKHGRVKEINSVKDLMNKM